MRIVVDYDRCEANARCVQQAPAVFHTDEKDQLHVLMPRPGPELREAVEAAAALCPRQALTIVDDES